MRTIFDEGLREAIEAAGYELLYKTRQDRNWIFDAGRGPEGLMVYMLDEGVYRLSSRVAGITNHLMRFKPRDFRNLELSFVPPEAAQVYPWVMSSWGKVVDRPVWLEGWHGNLVVGEPLGGYHWTAVAWFLNQDRSGYQREALRNVRTTPVE